MPQITISLRLTLWFSTVFLIGFAIFGAVMWLSLSWSLNAGRDRTLKSRAARIASALEHTSPVATGNTAADFDVLVRATPEGNLIQVFDLGGHLLYPARSSGITHFPWPRVPDSEPEYWGKIIRHGRHYRVLARTIYVQPKPVRLFIAGQLEDNRTNLAHFETGLLFATPVLIAGSGLFGFFVSRRALKPIDRLIASARSITIGNLSRRLPVSHTNDELSRLAETCNDMLARLETAIGQITRFTADASHELRSPIAYIRTVAECTLRSPDINPEAEAALGEIVAETEHATQLLADMLFLARSDSGHIDTEFEPVDIEALFHQVAERAAVLAGEKGQTLKIDCAASNVQVFGDAGKLRRLFWVLLENAIKYTTANGCISISSQRTNGSVTVAVTDTGIGIPQSSLARVFDRFFRVDNARSTQEGTGLGLAIAKWIADVHCGTLTVESQEGVGSTFRVELPLLPEASTPNS